MNGTPTPVDPSSHVVRVNRSQSDAYQEYLTGAGLRNLERLHESLEVIRKVISSEGQRPCHRDNGTGDFLDRLYDDVCLAIAAVSREVEKRPVTTYDEAVIRFKMRTEFDEGDEHLKEVLILLSFAKAKAAA